MSSYLFFSSRFQGKKIHNLKTHPPHHIEPFDIKIDYFDGQNHHQQQLSFSKLESIDLFSLLHQKNKIENYGK